MTKQIFPNLERVANAPRCYGALALDSASAGRHSAALLDARAALFESPRRDASRPYAFEGESVARGSANCNADVSRRRALKRSFDAQAMVPAFWEHVSVTATLKRKSDAEDKCIAARRVEQRTTPRAKPSDARGASFDLARRDALTVCSSWRRGRGVELRAAKCPQPPNLAKNANAIGAETCPQNWNHFGCPKQEPSTAPCAAE